jgi:hypothetical protein
MVPIHLEGAMVVRYNGFPVDGSMPSFSEDSLVTTWHTKEEWGAMLAQGRARPITMPDLEALAAQVLEDCKALYRYPNP